MANFARQPSSAEGSITRRSFLKGARYLGFTAATLPWLMRDWTTSAIAAVNIQDLSPETTPPPATTAPAPTTGSGTSPDYNLFQSPQTYTLSLGGGPPVQVFGFHGGEPLGQYVTGTVMPDGSFPKKVSGVRYEDIVFYYLPIKGAAINTWLIDSMLGKAPAVSGAIHIQGSLSAGSGNVVMMSYGNHVSFSGAFVKQIAFPEADRMSGAPAPLRITMTVQ